MAARLVMQKSRSDDAMPILKELHWLPVAAHVHHKTLTYIYKAIEGTAPSYLSDLIEPYVPRRRLRSEGLNLLEVPKYERECYGQRKFSSAAPDLWNRLPDDMRGIKTLAGFKKQLKTHLFKYSFIGNKYFRYPPRLV